MPKYDLTEAKQCIDDRVQIVKSYWQNRQEVWNEIYSLYKFWTQTYDEITRGERSNIFIPIAFSIVETKLPRLVQALLSLDPFFKVEGRTEKDQANARFMGDVMDFQLKDELNSFSLFVMWWKEALMYGQSYMYLGWEKEKAKVKERYPTGYGSEIIGYDYRMKEDTIYDGPAMNHLDLFDCYPAPHGTRINGRRFDRMPYFCLRAEPTAEYLKALSDKIDQNGISILEKSAVDDILKRFPQGFGDIDDKRKERMGYSGMTEAGIDTNAPRYVMWTMFEHDWWISKIGNTIVRNKENPFGDNNIPIVKALDTPIPHEHGCIGQIEPIIKLQYYANDLENLTLDWLFKSINPGAFASQESLVDPKKFIENPDGIHLVKGSVQGAYAPIIKPNLNMLTASNEKINLERLIDKVLGQSDVSRGVSRPGKDTATEIVSLIEQANFRFDLSVRLLKHDSLIPFLDMLSERNIMFWPYEKEIRKYTESGEPEFMNVPVSRLIGKYRFKMRTNPAQGNKIAYAQTLIRFLDVVNASQGRNIELVKEIGKYLDIEDIDNKIANPAEDAVMVIIQAAKEGLLANSRQAALVLSQVLNVLAPPGSPVAKSLKGAMPQAQDERDIARQTGRML